MSDRELLQQLRDALPVVPEGDAERCTLLIEWRPPAPVSGTGEAR